MFDNVSLFFPNGDLKSNLKPRIKIWNILQPKPKFATAPYNTVCAPGDEGVGIDISVLGIFVRVKSLKKSIVLSRRLGLLANMDPIRIKKTPIEKTVISVSSCSFKNFSGLSPKSSPSG